MSRPISRQIRPWASLVQTSSRVVRGMRQPSSRVRADTHRSRPVYSSARASQAMGMVTMPRYWSLAQKILVGRLPLASSST